MAQLVEKIVDGVKTAQATAEPVTLEAGVAQQFGLSFNRRFHMKTGPVRFNPGVLIPTSSAWPGRSIRKWDYCY